MARTKEGSPSARAPELADGSPTLPAGASGRGLILRIVADSADADRLARLAAALAGASASDARLEVDLGSDRSPEEILSLCRADGITVRASAVRHRGSRPGR